MREFITKGVKTILWVKFLFFVFFQTADKFFATKIGAYLALWPPSQCLIWQPLSYILIEYNFSQFFFNLLTLAFLGPSLEILWGTRRFVLFCGFCAIGTSIIYLLACGLFPQISFPLFGFGPIIYGLLAAYGVIFSGRTLLLMLVFPIQAKYFVLILALMEFLTGIYEASPQSLIQVFAMGLGYLGILVQTLTQKFFQNRAKNKNKVLKSSSHLRLVVNQTKEDDSPKDPPFWN